MHAVEFPVFNSPKDILDAVTAPAEVGSVPSKEIRFPIFQQRPVLWVGRTPTARDGIAEEVNIDASLFRFLNQLLVCQSGVGVGTWHGPNSLGEAVGFRVETLWWTQIARSQASGIDDEPLQHDPWVYHPYCQSVRSWS